MTPHEKLMLYMMAGAFMSLIGKIVWDWLKNRRPVEAVERHTASERSEYMLSNDRPLSPSGCMEFHKGLTKWQGDTNQSLTKLTNIVENHEKRLEEGRIDFKEISKSIADLSTSYKVLASKTK